MDTESDVTPPADPGAAAALREQIGARDPFAGTDPALDDPSLVDEVPHDDVVSGDELDAEQAATVDAQVGVSDPYGAGKHLATDEATDAAGVDEQTARPDPLGTDRHAGGEPAEPAPVERQIAGPAAP